MPYKDQGGRKQPRPKLQKPAWDNAIHDLQAMKLTKAQMEAKRTQLQSHNHVAVITQRMLESLSNFSESIYSDNESEQGRQGWEHAAAGDCSGTSTQATTSSVSTDCNKADSLSEFSESLSDGDEPSQDDCSSTCTQASSEEDSKSQRSSDSDCSYTYSDSDSGGRSLQRRATAFVRSTKGPAVPALPEPGNQDCTGTVQKDAGTQEMASAWSGASERAAMRGDEAAAEILNWPSQGRHPLETRRSGAVIFTGTSCPVSRQPSPKRQPVKQQQGALPGTTSKRPGETNRVPGMSCGGGETNQSPSAAAGAIPLDASGGELPMRAVAVAPESSYEAGAQQQHLPGREQGDEGAPPQSSDSVEVNGEKSAKDAGEKMDGELARRIAEIEAQIAEVRKCYVAFQAEITDKMGHTTAALAQMQRQLSGLAAARPFEPEQPRPGSYGRGALPRPARKVQGSQPQAANCCFPGAHLLPRNLALPCQPDVGGPLRDYNRVEALAAARTMQENRKPAHRTLRFPADQAANLRGASDMEEVGLPLPRSLPRFLSQGGVSGDLIRAQQADELDG